MSSADSRRATWGLIALIVLGLVAWGAFHVVGAARQDVRRGIVVAAFFVAFLIFWGTLLWVRSRRPPRH